jgi:hypothetical protein
MKDPELNEDQDLQPYQGELFPKTKKVSFRGWWEDFISRGEARGNQKYTPKANYDGSNPASDIKIEYD